MTEAEVYQALLEGPNSRRVLLGAGVRPEVLARYAAGLSNNEGGIIIIGATANRVEDASGLDPLQLNHVIFNLSGGAILAHIERIETPEGAVWVLTVPKSPHAVAVGPGPAPYWDGRRLVALPVRQQPPSAPDPTAQILTEADSKDLDPAELHRLRQRLQERGSALAEASDLELARGLGMLNEEDLPTIAGLLLAGSRRALARHLPQAEVSYYRHEEDDVDYTFREDMLRPIPAALDRLRELIQAKNRFHPLTIGLFRIEVWDFDVEVYREALLNAFVHRDWTAHDTIQVHHHPDRLEISNPGGLPAGMTPENILRHPPHRRNPALAAALAQLGYIERAGLGVDKMYRLLLRYGKEPPEYQAWPQAVTLILHNPGFDADFVRWVAEAQDRQGSFTLDYLIVLARLRRGPQTTKGLAAALQLTPARTRRLLEKMSQAGLIEAVGSGRGRRWQLVKT